jgi:hypothetical protein
VLIETAGGITGTFAHITGGGGTSARLHHRQRLCQRGQELPL